MWMLSVSSAVIGKGPPQRKGNHERNHFLFPLFLKHGVLQGHLEEEEEGPCSWALTLGLALLSPLHVFLFFTFNHLNNPWIRSLPKSKS